MNEKDFVVNFPLLSARKFKIGFGRDFLTYLVSSGVLDDVTGLHVHCFDGKLDNVHKVNFPSKREVKQTKLINFGRIHRPNRQLSEHRSSQSKATTSTELSQWITRGMFEFTNLEEPNPPWLARVLEVLRRC